MTAITAALAAIFLLALSTGAQADLITIQSPCSKATAKIDRGVAGAFRGLLGDLCRQGYKPRFMGGWRRGQCAPPRHKHPCGWAIDIDQVARGRVTQRQPGNVNAMARRWGLLHGAEWRNNDRGHFEVISKVAVARALAVRVAAVVPVPRPRPADASQIVAGPEPEPRTLGALMRAESASLAVQVARTPVPSILSLPQPFVDPEDDTQRCLAYLIATATIGHTMEVQTPRVAIGNLHPEYRKRLCSALPELRTSGFETAGIYSAYRPPGLRVGGFRNKFQSEHAYGLAVDMAGVGRPRSQDSFRAHVIMARHDVFGVYGPNNGAEWNHFQAVLQKAVPERSALRATITAAGPVVLESMWAVAMPLINLAKASPFKVVTASPRARRHTRMARRHGRHRRYARL
jgi:hypothetical protein